MCGERLRGVVCRICWSEGATPGESVERQKDSVTNKAANAGHLVILRGSEGFSDGVFLDFSSKG